MLRQTWLFHQHWSLVDFNVVCLLIILKRPSFAFVDEPSSAVDAAGVGTLFDVSIRWMLAVLYVHELIFIVSTLLGVGRNFTGNHVDHHLTF